jgi:hypothetical protein
LAAIRLTAKAQPPYNFDIRHPEILQDGSSDIRMDVGVWEAGVRLGLGRSVVDPEAARIAVQLISRNSRLKI